MPSVFNLATFNIDDLARCTKSVNKLGSDSETSADFASSLVTYLYDHFKNEAGKPACALIRFFQTMPYANIGKELQSIVDEELQQQQGDDLMTCMILRATRGHIAEWNSTRYSNQHRVIPMPNEKTISRVPMLSQLIRALGFRLTGAGNSVNSADASSKTNQQDVLLVADPGDNSIIPEQAGFVVPFGIKSALGLGSLLPSGNMFALLMFTNVDLPVEIRETLKSLLKVINLRLSQFDDNTLIEAANS